MRVLLLFLDGVGLGEHDAARNVFVASPPPNIVKLLDGALPVAGGTPIRTQAATLLALDATLGVAGTPQSGTGHAALLTGTNAAAQFGRHFGPWVPAALRSLVREENLLTRAARAGRSIAFANAYPEEVMAEANAIAEGGSTSGNDSVDAVLPPDLGNGRARRASRYLSAGPPLAALGAGVLNRHTPELERGAAIASEITNEGWRQRLGRRSLPEITPREAGRNLARIVAAHDLTLFAHYATDYAGHQRSMPLAVRALQLVDAFIGGVLEHLPDDALLIVSSDHGNLEDITTDHTRNHAIGLAAGHGHAEITRDWTSITDIVPSILAAL